MQWIRIKILPHRIAVTSNYRPYRKEPVHPKPNSDKTWFVLRILKGLHSWIEVPKEENFVTPGNAIRFLGLNIFIVNKLSEIKRIKVRQFERFPKHRLTLWTLEPLIGRGIFSVNGEEWQQQRILIDQAFKVAQLRKVLPQMRGAVDALLGRLHRIADGRSVKIDEEMTLVTADVIIRTILSQPIDSNAGAEIFEAFTNYQRRAGRAGILKLFRLNERFLQRYLGRDAIKIRSWIEDCISERKKLIANNKDTEGYQDLLQAMIDAHDPETGYRFNDRDLVDQVCFLFLAGHETSASSLGMATYLLSQFPDVQEQFHQELQSIINMQGKLPKDKEAPFGYDDLKLMSFGSAIFNETLRLYPPVSFMFHEPTEPSEVLGRRCPLSSLIVISPWVIQRHRDHWQRPNTFEPERFLEATSTAEEQHMGRDAFLPFGMGPRKCPGAAFAMQEALLVLAEVVRRYEILPDDLHTPRLVSRLTLRSSNGIRVKLLARNPS